MSFVIIPYFKEFDDGDCQIMDILANVPTLEMERNKIGFALSCQELIHIKLSEGDDLYRLWFSFIIMELFPDLEEEFKSC